MDVQEGRGNNNKSGKTLLLSHVALSNPPLQRPKHNSALTASGRLPDPLRVKPPSSVPGLSKHFPERAAQYAL